MFALDLSLVVPALLVGAFWLWQDRPWGYALAVIVNAKGAVYTLSLAVSSVIAVRAGLDEVENEFSLWIVLAAGHAAAAHRQWMGARSTLSGHDDGTVLAETRRGDALTVQTFKNAVAYGLPATVRDLVERHLTELCHAHDQITELERTRLLSL